jgi:hypothetical protein
MLLNFLTVFALSVFSLIVLADDACYAPPLSFGGKCISSDGLVGSDTTTITYNIDPASDATQVLCQGLGAGPEGGQCSFGWYDIGSGGISMMWGANDGTPAIQCKGVPLGTTLDWSWDSGDSTTNSCGFNVNNNYEKSETDNVELDVELEMQRIPKLNSEFYIMLVILGILILILLMTIGYAWLRQNGPKPNYEVIA